MRRQIVLSSALLIGMLAVQARAAEVHINVNIGAPPPIIVHSAPRMVYLPQPTDDPSQRKPDIDLARKVLNWEPEISLETGLSKTIAYFRNRMP